MSSYVIESNLKDIIELKNQEPNIINDNSRFVVVTYWWGRNNLNQNTARPCVSFFEDIVKRLVKISENGIIVFSKNSDNIEDIYKVYNTDFPKLIVGLKDFKKLINKITNVYIGMIYEFCELNPRELDKHTKTIQFLENFKNLGKTPVDYKFETIDEFKRKFEQILKQIITVIKPSIFKLYGILIELKKIKSTTYNIQQLTTEEKQNIKNRIHTLEQQKKNIDIEIKKILNTNQVYPDLDNHFQNKSIYNILNLTFRFLNPITYDDMINKWENECRKTNCNYMAIEYPEFARPGGYQMAINAKPLFIKKALELCVRRSVLYIDGDMFVRKYPSIFDIQDVDFMARGWWIDPRSSYKMDESIMYDPYTFETSGGTMFFSQSFESKMLIDKWIAESSKIYQQGKADDRIISLIFNTYKLVLSMKVIQLPIEYLWLSLDYDERLLDTLYDDDRARMLNSIFIEHPECLTTEDTASSHGASSDRTPKYYNFIQDNLVPVSEELHELLNFPNEEMVNAFKDYYNYMNNKTYIDDGNPELYNRGFVNPENPAENEQPLYVISYNDKYGNKIVFKETDNETGEILKYSRNDIHNLNMQRAEKISLQNLNLKNIEDNSIEVNNTTVGKNEFIPLIIKLLMENRDVIYNPENIDGYNETYLKNLLSNPIYKKFEFIFVPNDSESKNYNDFYKPKIQLNQPIKFSHSNKVLIEYLSMYLSLDEFSDFIHNGSYEFISRIRVGYLTKPSVKKNNGGGITYGGNNEDLDKYVEGLNFMYGNVGGYRKPRKPRKTRKIRRTRKRNKKNRKISKKRFYR